MRLYNLSTTQHSTLFIFSLDACNASLQLSTIRHSLHASLDTFDFFFRRMQCVSTTFDNSILVTRHLSLLIFSLDACNASLQLSTIQHSSLDTRQFFSASSYSHIKFKPLFHFYTCSILSRFPFRHLENCIQQDFIKHHIT